MQRVIKFRIWHILRNEMSPDYEYCIEGEGMNKAFTDNSVIFLQFTGLRDKNGKEIYEGDILKWAWVKNSFHEKDGKRMEEKDWEREYEHPTQFRNSVVVFDGGSFYVDGQYGHEGKEFSFRVTEVIGNIYETPELIEKKQ